MYRPVIFKGYQQFYAALLDTPGLPQWFNELVSLEKSAEAKAWKRLTAGVILVFGGLAGELIGSSMMIGDSYETGVPVMIAGVSISMVGLIVELIGAVQTARHRPSRTVIPEFNMRVAE